MSALYESYEDQLKRYMDHFLQTPGQNGFLVAINAEVAGMGIFDSTDNLAKYFGKLVQSYALDAFDLERQKQRAPTPGTREKVESWLAEVKKSPALTNPSLGLGKDLRLEGERLIGSGLLFEETVLYLSIFTKAQVGEQGGTSSRMARASRRSNFSE